MTSLAIKKGMVLFVVIACLSGCVFSPRPHQEKVAAPAIATPSPAPSHVADGAPGEKTGNEYTASGDFAGGSKLTSVLGDMTVKSTIIQLLDKHAAHISLRHVAEYADKATREDLMAFQERDASFVTMLDLSTMGLNDRDLEAISKLKLTNLNVDDNQMKDLHAIKDMKTLTNLCVSGCPLNLQGISVIASLKNLSTLSMRRTPITDKELASLYHLNLGLIYLCDCSNLSEKAVEEWQRHSPKCVVISQSEQRDLATGFSDLMRINASLMKDGEFEEADMSLKGVISRWQNQSPVPYPLVARGYRLRSICQAKLKRPDQACQMYDDSLDIYAKHIPDNSEWPDVRMEYANFLQKQDRLPEATVQRKAADLFWQSHKPGINQVTNYVANKQWLAQHK